MASTAAPGMSAPPKTGAEAAPVSAPDGVLNKQNEVDKLPLLEDVMQLSRLGDIQAVKALFDSGKIRPDYKDNEGITPLHVSSQQNYCTEY